MPQSKTSKNCPFCGERVEDSLESCPFCKRIFRLDYSPQEQDETGNNLKYIILVSVILIVATGLLILILSSDGEKNAGTISIEPKIVNPPVVNDIQQKDTIPAGNPDSALSVQKDDTAKKPVVKKGNETTPEKKPATIEKIKVKKPKKPPSPSLPKPKEDRSDFYTLG